MFNFRTFILIFFLSARHQPPEEQLNVKTKKQTHLSNVINRKQTDIRRFKIEYLTSLIYKRKVQYSSNH